MLRSRTFRTLLQSFWRLRGRGCFIIEAFSKIEQIFTQAGIPVVGACSFAPLRPFLLHCRAEKRLPQGAKSVIVALFPYSMEAEAYAGGNLSRYACVRDYHEIVPQYLNRAADQLRALFPGEQFEAFADNSPIPEVRAAALAGLGRIGRNGLLIHERYGSWVFIGELVTTLSLELPLCGPLSCLDCGRCLLSCPAGALTAAGLNRQKCLSAVTQRKGELGERERERIRSTGCAWGCDICQIVCPMNDGVLTRPLPEFEETFRPAAEPGGPLEGRAYAWRGRKVIERNLCLLSEQGKGVV